MDVPEDDIKSANIVLGGRYQLIEIIGQGSFGKIFKASVKDTDAVVAVKVEKRSNHAYVTLARESKTLSDLNGRIGFPNLYAYGREEKFNFMVTSLLGLNLEKLLKLCNRKFTLKSVLMLADQMLTRIEILHEHNYIHRDIKPENFVMGIGSSTKNLFLIDFGLARQYKDSNGTHISYKESKGLIGTARYASINAHLGIEQSRRDDLEAIGYTLIYFAKGKLPWQNITASNKHEKYMLIAELKMKTPIEILCQDLPKEFGTFLTYVKNLGFQDVPNYKYLKKLFRKLFLESGYDFDYMYDWNKHIQGNQSTRLSKVHNEREIKNGELMFGGFNQNVQLEPLGWKSNGFGKPQMAHALNLKSKDDGLVEEAKGEESEADYPSTEKLSKGVTMEKLHRGFMSKRNESSSRNTSKLMHVSGLRFPININNEKLNEEEISPIDLDNDSPSRKFEEYLSFTKIKTIELNQPDSPSQDQPLGPRRLIQKTTSFKFTSRSLPQHQSIFGRLASMNNAADSQVHESESQAKGLLNKQRRDEDLSEALICEWIGPDTLSSRINHWGLKPLVKKVKDFNSLDVIESTKTLK